MVTLMSPLCGHANGAGQALVGDMAGGGTILKADAPCVEAAAGVERLASDAMGPGKVFIGDLLSALH
jgi:hypothetical protein